jgi:hypothetical protein
MARPTPDDALDLGDIEAGEHPAKRDVAPGAHPWAPSQVDAYSQATIPADAIEAALPAITWGTAEGGFVDWPTADDAWPIAVALIEALGFRITGLPDAAPSS